MKAFAKFLLVTAVLIPFFVFSYANADTLGQNVVFNISKEFDRFERESISATLRHVGGNAYFYVDDDYWGNLNSSGRQNFLANIDQLSDEFDTVIYPIETAFWGQESKPGVDGDVRMTILLEQLKDNHGGYFSTSNGYPKKLAPKSNEREMLVIGTESIDGPYAKVFLAHEFEHLISFNQKELLRNVGEEIWLNELRAEYSTTLVGYNETFRNSNLERRANSFFSEPSDSLTEWPNVSQDYAMVAILGEYISEKYGSNVFRDSLLSNQIGIPSINSVLASGGSSDRFFDLFANWLVASYVNDDSVEAKFGYTRQELRDLQAQPQRVTMLNSSNSNTFSYSLKPWQPYGHKFHINNSLSGDTIIKLSPSQDLSFVYFDNLGRFGVLSGNFFITNPGGLEHFFIFPVNGKKILGFSTSESETVGHLTLSFEEKTVDMDFGSALKNGALIKKQNESEIYVIEGKYKRYLRPEVIDLYGHLDASKAIEVDDGTFHSYTTTNYVRYVDGERVYAVWPDGTKHWLNITPRQWDDSGRDWGAIFIINDLEINTYQTGADITR